MRCRGSRQRAARPYTGATRLASCRASARRCTHRAAPLGRASWSRLRVCGAGGTKARVRPAVQPGAACAACG